VFCFHKISFWVAAKIIPRFGMSVPPSWLFAIEMFTAITICSQSQNPVNPQMLFLICKRGRLLKINGWRQWQVLPDWRRNKRHACREGRKVSIGWQ
jgi:hypothetical protein